VREELKQRDGKRGRFTGTVKRFGKKPAYKGAPLDTLLLVDLRDEAGTEVTDHLWFVVRKQLKELNLQPGDKIEFTARVTTYIKGYRGRREDDWDRHTAVSVDYRLSHPTQFKKVGNIPVDVIGLPLFQGTQ
jgi:hypothetical protein